MEHSQRFESVVSKVYSSYSQNRLGNIFYRVVTEIKPGKIVELGCLEGYSLLYMLKAVTEIGLKALLEVYDLWEHYEYRHASMETPQENIICAGLSPSLVSFHRADAFEVAERYAPLSVDLLHIDISNDGDTLEKLFNQWDRIIKPDGVIMFEGGSTERDRVDWMVKYDKRPIQDFIMNSKIAEAYRIETIESFPSLTICRRKTDAQTS